MAGLPLDPLFNPDDAEKIKGFNIVLSSLNDEFKDEYSRFGSIAVSNSNYTHILYMLEESISDSDRLVFGEFKRSYLSALHGVESIDELIDPKKHSVVLFEDIPSDIRQKVIFKLQELIRAANTTDDNYEAKLNSLNIESIDDNLKNELLDLYDESEITKILEKVKEEMLASKYTTPEQIAFQKSMVKSFIKYLTNLAFGIYLANFDTDKTIQEMPDFISIVKLVFILQKKYLEPDATR